MGGQQLQTRHLEQHGVEEEVASLGPLRRVLDQTLPDEVPLALVLQRLDALLDDLLGDGAAGVAAGDLQGRRLQGAHPEGEDVDGGGEGDRLV